MATAQVGRVALGAVDHVVIKRFQDAIALEAKVRAAMPGRSSTDISAAIIRRIARELGTAGAVAGAMAAAPAIGTTATLASTAADVGLAFGRMSVMVMAVGLAYGADLSDGEVRKQHIYAVFSGSSHQLTEGERAAGDLKKKLGQQALTRRDTETVLPGRMGKMTELATSRVGTRVISRVAAQEMAIKIGTLLPLGVGAGVGAIGNRALVNSVGRTAQRYFASGVVPNYGGPPTTAGPPHVIKPLGPGELPATEKRVSPKKTVRDRLRRRSDY
jgi:EcsC protein family